MSGYVCSIVSAKGGVGKTTTAINVGAALSANGRDVVVVDGDLQMPNLAGMLGVETGTGLHTVLTNGKTVEESVVEGPAGLSIVPGEVTLDAYADADPAGLGRAIERLREQYDVVLVDTGGGLSHAMTVAINRSDGVVCLSTSSDCAVVDAKKTLSLVERADGDVIGGVLTRANWIDDVDGLDDLFDVPFLGVVPTDYEAAGDEPVVVTHPDSDIADAYVALTELLEQVIFEGADPADLGLAFVEGWFDAEVAEPDLDSGESQGGSFALFQ